MDNSEYFFSIIDYAEIISCLPKQAFDELRASYKAGLIKNKKTKRAFEILLEPEKRIVSHGRTSKSTSK